MPSHHTSSSKKSGFCWPAILRTLLIQIVVLIALTGAVVRYLNWSSDAAWAEFIAASGPAAPGMQFHPLYASPAEASPPLYGWRI